MATLRNHNAHRDIGFMTDRGETGNRITHPNLPEGKEQVTLPMNFSPLSVSPVGEMQVTPLRQRLGDAGYSALAEIGRCRLLRFGNDWEMEGTPLRQRLRDAGTDAAQLIPTTEKGSQK